MSPADRLLSVLRLVGIDRFQRYRVLEVRVVLVRSVQRVRVVAICLFVLIASRANAQVASLGKGWLLGPLGSISTASGEVISGRSSIKGIKGSTADAQFLISDPNAVPLAPNQSYTISFTYRIITPAQNGFEYGFTSNTGIAARDFGPSALFFGSSGSTGTVTNTFSLHNWPDYQVRLAMFG